jgi:prevent-host-death family protein
MATVNVRELARRASAVVADVASTGRPTLVTKRGKPVAAVIALSSEDLEDVILERSPEYVADLVAADKDLAAGRTRSAADVFAELERDDD